MRQATLISFLLVALLLPSLLFAASAPTALSTRILTATPTQSVVTAEFDVAAVSDRIGKLEFSERPTDGYGLMLAIAGQGTPEARVVRYELGETLASPLAASLQSGDIAASPADLATLGTPAILHDLRVVNVGFYPLVRDGGAIRLVRSVDVEIATRGSGGVNSRTEPVSFSSAFYPVYRAAVANLDEIYPDVSLRAPGRYLVVGPQGLMTTLQNTTAWKRWFDLKVRKGYQMQVLALTDTSGNGTRAAIAAAYNDPAQRDLEYVLLVGDHGPLPSQELSNPEHTNEDPSVGDNFYFRLAGDDLLPDVLAGRVSGRTADEYIPYFAKVWRYETRPYTDDMHWFESITCAAGNFSDNTYPVTPVWNVNWARERLMRDGCITDADTFYYHNRSDGAPGDFTTAMLADMNAGVSMVLYRGWAAEQLWWYPTLTNSNAVNDLQLGERNPAFFSIVCGSGDFGYPSGQCLGEVLTTGVGTFNQSNGAIIYFGASDLHTNTRHNNAVLAGIVDALLGGVRSGGALALAGKLEGWRQFPREQGGEDSHAHFYVLHVFNLLGDPETQIYACTPGSFTDVTHPAALTMGATQVPVTVTSNGMPVQGAVVSLRLTGSTDVTVATTDWNGQALVPANLALADTTAELTVWRAGYFQKLIEIPVENHAFDPKITGVTWTAGADNLPNPGETADFSVTVANTGTASLLASLNISSSDPRVTVTAGSAMMAETAPGASTVVSGFTLQLAGELYDGQCPPLSVVFADGSNSLVRLLPVPVTAPEPAGITFTVSGDANGNGILEAGENADVTPTVTNIGHQAGAGLTVAIDSWDNAVSFTDTEAAWASLAIDASAAADDPFHMAVAPGVTPGRQVLLHCVFSQNGVVVARKEVLFPIGVVTVNAPTGPDAYGYYAYEDIDAGFNRTPVYNWVELDPALSGNGVPNTVHDDYYFDMPLPRPFTFYGEDHDHIWISSNGWVSFDSMRIPEFRNWELPSPMGAPYMICPFWEDLIGKHMAPNADTVFTVWTLDDAANDRFIIQWRALNREGMPNDAPGIDTAFCTFELILEETSVTGDDEILVQYNQVLQTDRGEGNYATVGIQDGPHHSGLNVTFSNFYPPSVDSLRPGRAIRFSTTPPDNFSGVEEPGEPVLPARLALHAAYPNPFNPATILRFDLPQTGPASLKVYDVLGRNVATLVDGVRAAGRYSVTFDGRGLSSGLYFARLEAATGAQVQKLMLVK